MKPHDSEIQEIVSTAEESETRAWLLTYADMITLLLTFFVMLLAISSLDNERFEDIMHSIQFTLGASTAPGGQVGRINVHDVKQMSLSQPTGSEMDPILKDIRKTVDMKDLDDVLMVERQGNRIIIRTKGQVLFKSGSATFSARAKKILNEIARIAKHYPGYRLHVGGHTDPRPIHNAKFASNWELSALRATAVLRYLISKGVNPRHLTATGYADTDPLVPNTSPENMAKNRRVEFILEKIPGY